MILRQQFNRLMSSQSLKKKWAISSAAVMFAGFAVMCIILYVALKGWLYQQEKLEVRRTMTELTDFFESQGPFLTIQDIQSNTGLMTSIVDKDQTVRLMNRDGIQLLQINNTTEFTPIDVEDIPKESFAVLTDDESTITAIGNVRLGRFEGYVQLQHPLSSFNSMMAYILTAMSLLGICSLLFSGAIGYLLASYLLKPLKELKSTMDDVAAHGLNKELAIEYNADDEIGELVSVFDSMMAKLKKSFEQQQQFMADASHELRTPIQIVEGHLSLLNRWGKEDPEILKESLGISLMEIQQMKALIDEMLELARGEQHEAQIQIDIIEQTSKVIEEMSRVYPSADIVHQLPEHGELETPVSANAYQQIMRNLITNAIRYSQGKARVEISYGAEGQNLVVHVKDHGIGIPDEHLQKIFDRFYRVDPARSRNLGGSGLGLSIVKMLVESSGGTIRAVSIEGQGSTFSIILPAAR